MLDPIKQTRVSALTMSLMMLCGMALSVLSGCPSVDTSSQAQCDAARRCGPGDVEVCGEDGQTYACAALARCEGVIVDPSAQACAGEPSPCDDSALNACDLFCPDGYAQDEDGCSTCACKPIDCPAVEPPVCSRGERTRCAPDDVCGTNCWCEPLDCPAIACNLFCANGFKTDESGCELCECNGEEPVCAYAACPPNTRSECAPDRDGDGCAECSCLPIECDDVDPVPECDGPGERIVCFEAEDGCEKCWCEPNNCPAVEPPTCAPGERTRCAPDDVCGSDCWCEPLGCPPLQPVGCEGGEVKREFDRNGCAYLLCEGATCPAFDCIAPSDCPYGPARDENGCETCSCFEPEECAGQSCDLFCEYGRAVSADGCLLCACNPPPLCEPLDCRLFCANGYVKDQFGCDTCACEQGSSCLDDEQCGFDEACVFDFMDPVDCCRPGETCDANIPLCVGECQVQQECGPNAVCPPDSVCDAVTRDDCCHPAALTCTDNLPICPLLCLEL